MVEDSGIEPLTSWMQIRRSPSWANPPWKMVGRGRLERPTSPLSGVRSNHLSYRPLGLKRHFNLKEEKWGRPHQLLFFVTKRNFLVILRKEVIQPQVPLRLPCYDFTPVADRTVVKGISFALRCNQLPWCDGRCVQDPGTYSPRRADPRLLVIPASCTRVAEYNPNWGIFLGFAKRRRLASYCKCHCSTCVAQHVRAMRTWRHPHLPPAYHWQFF